jgi:6-phosphogluconolactonase
MMHIYPNPERAAEQCAQYLAQLLEDAIHERGAASVAFSGGSSPRRMFAHLLNQAVDWTSVHAFQVDERGVPPGHPLSNFTMIEESLLRPAQVPPMNVHRIHAELGTDEAAARYADNLRERLGANPVLDVIVCGVGPDAHTASLFPGDPLVADRSRLVACTFVEKLAQERVTLLPRVLLHARNLLVLATGSDKADALTRVFDDRTPVIEAPAKVLFETTGSLHWYLDETAAPR